MFEAEWLQMKSQLPIMKIPLFRQRKKLPFSAAPFTPMIVGIQFFPPSVFFWGIPDNLGIWSAQSIFPPSFQFFSSAAINHFIFFPFICYPHRLILLLSFSFCYTSCIYTSSIDASSIENRLSVLHSSLIIAQLFPHDNRQSCGQKKAHVLFPWGFPPQKNSLLF